MSQKGESEKTKPNHVPSMEVDHGYTLKISGWNVNLIRIGGHRPKSVSFAVIQFGQKWPNPDNFLLKSDEINDPNLGCVPLLSGLF